MKNFTIQRYETGWDKEWQNRNGSLVVQAHAPSIVILKAASDVSVGVRARVKEGGRTSAGVTCNGREVSYGERVEVSLRAGEKLQLEARIEGSKDQCWNYWEIEDAAIVFSDDTAVSFWSGAHLGDSLGMLIGSENFARANGVTLQVKSTRLFEEICNLFVFDHIRLVGEREQMVHVHPFGYNFEELGWIRGIAKALHMSLGGKLPLEVTMPRLRSEASPEKEDVILVQFDGRSGGVWPAASLKSFLASYAGNKIAVIGGRDTTAYLGDSFEYRKGNLLFIVRQLLACKKFVGTDSGIAHLACVLGMKIDLLPSPSVSRELVRGIFSSYPETPNYRAIAETSELPDRPHTVTIARMGNAMKCFILVGPESSGNHVFCSLFSQLRRGNEPIIGTDLAGWTDGRPKDHDLERFNDVWLGKKELDVSNPFVTSRSVPCGLVMPDIVGFCGVTRKLGFDPLVVVISRDLNINTTSARHHEHPWPTSRAISHIRETMRQVRWTVVSYEALVLYKELYFDVWLREHAPEFTCEPQWFNFIKDENKKWVK